MGDFFLKLLLFYFALAAPLVLLVLFAKSMSLVWFVTGLFAYTFYNIFLANRKLKRKGYHVGFFAHLNPFSKKSQDLYHNVYFEA